MRRNWTVVVLTSVALLVGGGCKNPKEEPALPSPIQAQFITIPPKLPTQPDLGPIVVASVDTDQELGYYVDDSFVLDGKDHVVPIHAQINTVYTIGPDCTGDLFMDSVKGRWANEVLVTRTGSIAVRQSSVPQTVQVQSKWTHNPPSCTSVRLSMQGWVFQDTGNPSPFPPKPAGGPGYVWDYRVRTGKNPAPGQVHLHVVDSTQPNKLLGLKLNRRQILSWAPEPLVVHVHSQITAVYWTDGACSGPVGVVDCCPPNWSFGPIWNNLALLTYSGGVALFEQASAGATIQANSLDPSYHSGGQWPPPLPASACKATATTQNGYKVRYAGTSAIPAYWKPLRFAVAARKQTPGSVGSEGIVHIVEAATDKSVGYWMGDVFFYDHETDRVVYHGTSVFFCERDCEGRYGISATLPFTTPLKNGSVEALGHLFDFAERLPDDECPGNMVRSANNSENKCINFTKPFQVTVDMVNKYPVRRSGLAHKPSYPNVHREDYKLLVR